MPNHFGSLNAMNCLCPTCGVERPVHLKFWMPSQIRSIWRSGSSTTSSFNCCRVCSPDCWVEDPLHPGVLAANLCIICGILRPGHRQYWMPSQVRSIWFLGSSVTSEFNCCRLCDPSCWTSVGPAHFAFPRAPHPAKPAPPPPPDAPPPRHPTATCYPPSFSPIGPSPRPPPPSPCIRRLDDVRIREDIRDIQKIVPDLFWELFVTRVKLPQRDELCLWGACLVPHSAAGLEALRLSLGGCDLRGCWVDFHTAVDCVQQLEIQIFVDPGNAVYTEFLKQVWPQASIWNKYSNEENIGDIT